MANINLNDITIKGKDGKDITFTVEVNPDQQNYIVKNKSTGVIVFTNSAFNAEWDKLDISQEEGNKLFLNLQLQAQKKPSYTIPNPAGAAAGGPSTIPATVPIPAWAKPEVTLSKTNGNYQSTLANNKPLQNQLGNLGNALSQIGNIQGNLAEVANDQFGLPTKDNEAKMYPIALMSSKQDVVLIQQFRYVAPNKDQFTNKNSANQVLEKGLIQNDFRFKEIVGGSVTLPMPQSFEEKRGVQFGEDTMNTLAAGLTQKVLGNFGGYMGAALGGAALNAAAQVAGGALSKGATGFSFGGLGGTARSLVAGKAAYDILSSGMAGTPNNPNASGAALLGSTVSSLMLKAAGMNVAAETILARGAGIIPNPNMELLFRSPELRNFGFAYKLTARGRDEAKMIRRIIRYFKEGMSPRKEPGGNNYFLKTPNVFKIQFKTSNRQNQSMPKFKTCALRGFTTDYSPDKMWAAYHDGHPVSVTIVMEFGELEPIYQNDFYNKEYGIAEDGIGF